MAVGGGRKNIFASYKNLKLKNAKRDVVKKYYQYGVDAIGFKSNNEPIDNYCIYRVNADTSSYSTLKAKVDEAIETQGMLVFMNHAYELIKDKINQTNKILNIIDYCQRNNVEILPLSDALQIRGNGVAVGDYASVFGIYASKNGFLKCGYLNIVSLGALIVVILSISSGILLIIRMKNR